MPVGREEGKLVAGAKRNHTNINSRPSLNKEGLNWGVGGGGGGTFDGRRLITAAFTDG